MITHAKIGPVFKDEIGEHLFSSLVRIYPEGLTGRAGHGFWSSLPVDDARTQVLSGIHLSLHRRDVFSRRRLQPVGNTATRSCVYSFNQGFRDGKSVLANGVLYSSIHLLGGIGNNISATL